MLPARRLGGGGGACGDSVLLETSPSTPIIGAGAGTFGRGEGDVFGFVAPDVDSVRISFDQDGETETLDAAAEQIPQDLLDRFPEF